MCLPFHFPLQEGLYFVASYFLLLAKGLMTDKKERLGLFRGALAIYEVLMLRKGFLAWI